MSELGKSKAMIDALITQSQNPQYKTDTLILGAGMVQAQALVAIAEELNLMRKGK